LLRNLVFKTKFFELKHLACPLLINLIKRLSADSDNANTTLISPHN
jgi:hypothetical protein